jgi:hypothetical protein
MAPTLAACLLLAALSLLGPSEPSYDPWAWLVWGREIAHLDLDTTGGPSWKPLPVILTTLVAPLSKLDDGVPAALWIVVARAGGLLTLVLAYRLAARVAGGGAARRVVAGTVAAVAIVLTPNWIRYLFHGNEVPLAVALSLWAVLCHLDGRRRAALMLGGLVCLARPELFGFVLLYGALLWRGSPASRRLVAVVLAAVPAAWLIPSWVGSGDPFFAGVQARSEPSWSLSLAPVPWRAALDVAQDQAWVALELAALAAVALALVGGGRGVSVLARGDRRGLAAAGEEQRRPVLAGGGEGFLPGPAQPGAVLALAGFAAVIVVLFAAMTEAGFSGNVRYVLPALVALCVLGGVGAGLLVDIGARVAVHLRGRRAAVAGALAAGVLLLAGAAPEIRDHVDAVELQTRESVERARLHAGLERAVEEVGPRYITIFAAPTANRSYQTHLAWELSLRLSDIQGARGRGLVFRTPVQEEITGVLRVYRRARDRTTIARVGKWTVSARPPNAPPVFTWPISGFSLRRAVARLQRPADVSLPASAPATGRDPVARS